MGELLRAEKMGPASSPYGYQTGTLKEEFDYSRPPQLGL